MLAGDEAASADFDVGQVAAAHLVVQQVAGQAGQAGGFVDGVGQPFGRLGPVLVARGPAAGICGVVVVAVTRVACARGRAEVGGLVAGSWSWSSRVGRMRG